MSSSRENATRAYWRASRRIMRNDKRMRLSAAAADIILIGHALDARWPRLCKAATATLVLARAATRAPQRTAGAEAYMRRPIQMTRPTTSTSAGSMSP
ncbi:MAG: hypothetical protein ACM30I_01750 [Gemmatimonas sp.]